MSSFGVGQGNTHSANKTILVAEDSLRIVHGHFIRNLSCHYSPLKEHDSLCASTLLEFEFVDFLTAGL
jgi:hypothetical protein